MMERPSVVFDERQIKARIAELGGEIAAHYAGEQLHVVGLLKNCLVFMADLIRAIPLDTVCQVLRVDHGPGGPNELVYPTRLSWTGHHVLLLDDVVDTGVTLAFLLDHVREQRPRSLRVCALIDRRRDRKVEVGVDWAAFRIDGELDRFLVGYGLDYRERYRGLPYIGSLPRPSGPPPDAQLSLGSDK
jgi:hypoxanthine phosphoribosyltransferase